MRHLIDAPGGMTDFKVRFLERILLLLFGILNYVP